jgi:DnaJ-class molecular chaperone
MFTAWKADEYLLGVHPNHARSAMAKVERHGKIPTLYEYKNMVRAFENIQVIAEQKCNECDGTGWDTGYKVTDSKMMEVDGKQAIYELGKVISDFYRDSNGYTYVIRCKKCAA